MKASFQSCNISSSVPPRRPAQGFSSEASNLACPDRRRVDLRERAEDTTVLERVRYVRDGKLVTSAGVSAGIDMSLWLVGQLFGVEHARATQRWMEYDPAPPYTADV